MSFTEKLVGWVVSPTGATMDRFVVHFTGHSPVSWVFARAARVEYNAPLLLTTIGRVSGKRRTVVLPHFAAGNDLCVVGSRGGSPTDPFWARNLRACPDAFIRMDRKNYAVHARLVEDSERDSLWASVTEQAPIYLEYQERAQEFRQIPLFVLTLQ